MELQVDACALPRKANAYMNGAHFGVNPVGVEYDPDEILASCAGTPGSALLTRQPAGLADPEPRGVVILANLSPAGEEHEAYALQVLRRADDRAPHMRDRAVVVAKAWSMRKLRPICR
jgi:hypothetical protein